MTLDAGRAEIEVRPDTSKFAADLRRQLGGLRGNVTGAFAGLASAASSALVGIGTAAAGVGVAFTAVSAAAAGLGIRVNSELETATLQFEGLLGSADEARARVASLFEFAKTTPFETQPIIEASRFLQLFGGDALAAEANLRLVGDAAAQTSQPIEDVAFWVGRAYAAIQGGQPFGEAAQRLLEMGIITPEVRARMEELQDAGAGADEVFGLLTDQLGTFGGSMARLASTMGGLTSTIADIASLSAADVFGPLFESTKRALGGLIAFSETPAFDAIKEQLRGLVADASTRLDAFVDTASEVLTALRPDQVVAAFDRIRSAVTGARGAIEGLEPLVAGLGVGFASMALRSVPLIGSLVPAISPIAGALVGVIASTDAGRDALALLASTIGEIVSTVGPQLLGVLREIVPVLSDAFADALTAAAPALGELAQAFADLVVAVAPELAGLIAAIAPAVGSIIAAGASVLADVLGVMADNADVLVPALGLLAAAFATIKITQLVNDFQRLTQLTGSVGAAVLNMASTAFPAATSAISNMVSGIGLLNPATALFTVTAGLAVNGVLSWMRAKAETARRVREFTDALERDSGALGENTQKLIENELAKRNQIDDLARMAGSFESGRTAVQVFTAALDGNAASAAEFRRAMLDTGEIVLDVGDNTGDTAKRIRDLEDAWAAGKISTDEFRDSVNELGGDMGAAVEGNLGLGRSLDGLSGELDDARQKLDDKRRAGIDTAAQDRELASATDDATRATSDLSAALGIVRDALDRAFGRADLNAAQLRFQQSLVSVREEIGRGAFTLDESTSAGLRNKAALQQMADNARTVATTTLEQTRSVDEASKAMGFQAALMVNELLPAFGGNERAAAQYTARLLGIPPERITEVTNTADLARLAADLYIDAVNKVPAEKRTTLVFDADVSRVRARLNELSRETGMSTGELFSRVERASGGPVPGPLGAPVPILAHGGEYVLSADVVDRIRRGAPSEGAQVFSASTAFTAPDAAPSLSGAAVQVEGDMVFQALDPRAVAAAAADELEYLRLRARASA